MEWSLRAALPPDAQYGPDEQHLQSSMHVVAHGYGGRKQRMGTPSKRNPCDVVEAVDGSIFERWAEIESTCTGDRKCILDTSTVLDLVCMNKSSRA